MCVWEVLVFEIVSAYILVVFSLNRPSLKLPGTNKYLELLDFIGKTRNNQFISITIYTRPKKQRGIYKLKTLGVK